MKSGEVKRGKVENVASRESHIVSILYRRSGVGFSLHNGVPASVSSFEAESTDLLFMYERVRTTPIPHSLVSMCRVLLVLVRPTLSLCRVLVQDLGFPAIYYTYRKEQIRGTAKRETHSQFVSLTMCNSL